MSKVITQGYGPAAVPNHKVPTQGYGSASPPPPGDLPSGVVITYNPTTTMSVVDKTAPIG